MENMNVMQRAYLYGIVYRVGHAGMLKADPRYFAGEEFFRADKEFMSALKAQNPAVLAAYYAGFDSIKKEVMAK